MTCDIMYYISDHCHNGGVSDDGDLYCSKKLIVD